MSELDLYWKTQKWAIETHGENAFVFMETGSFMECYGTDDFGFAKRASKILNMRCPKRNNKLPLSSKNPYMLGFQTDMSFKNIPVLLEAGIIIIWMSQHDVPHQKKKKREVTRIITSGTYVEHPTCDDEYNIAVVCKNDENQEYVIAVLEGTIGKLEVMTVKTLDEYVWFLNAYSPKEMLCYGLDESEKKMIDYSRLIEITMKKEYNDINYQQEMMNKVYNEQTVDERYLLVLTLMFNHVWLCNKRILEYVQYPKILCESTLTFYNNAVSQLDLLKSSKGCGLLSILDNTSTPMGKRLLKRQLLKPWIEPQQIEICYDETEKYLNDYDKTCKLRNLMCSSIPDLERILKRKISWETMSMIIDGFRNISNMESFQNHVELDDFLKECDSIFENVHEERVHPKVDIEYDRLCKLTKNIEEKIDAYIAEWTGTRSEYYKLNKEYNERDGWRITTTPKKAAELRTNVTMIQIIKMTKTNVKIETDETRNLCVELNKYSQQMCDAKQAMLQRVGDSLLTKHRKSLEEVVRQVAWMDTMISRCMFVKQHRYYTRPKITPSSESWIQASNMRHPLLEEFEICNGNSIYLNIENPGILMYGVNGSGKSIYAKSIATNIIMAQAGFFVPAESFEYYPFHRIFTRINCDDDLYQNTSSFVMEMKELQTILRLSNKNALVIGDELCKGTEDASALGIVAASIEYLANNNVKFIFASHLHKLPELQIVKQLGSNVRIQHMQTLFENNEWTFKRTIGDGTGEGVYGIEIAQFILNCPRLITNARSIRNHVMSMNNEMISTRKSKYTKEYAKSCNHCGSNVMIEHHHIEPQVKFGKEQNKQKNRKNNLLWLCKECHLKEHEIMRNV